MKELFRCAVKVSADTFNPHQGGIYVLLKRTSELEVEVSCISPNDNHTFTVDEMRRVLNMFQKAGRNSADVEAILKNDCGSVVTFGSCYNGDDFCFYITYFNYTYDQEGGPERRLYMNFNAFISAFESVLM